MVPALLYTYFLDLATYLIAHPTSEKGLLTGRLQ